MTTGNTTDTLAEQGRAALWAALRPLTGEARMTRRRRIYRAADALAARSATRFGIVEATKRIRVRLIRYAEHPPTGTAGRLRAAITARAFGHLRDRWPDGGVRAER